MPDDPHLPSILALLAEVRAEERAKAAARARSWAEFAAAHRSERIDKRFVEVWFLQCATEIEQAD